MKASPGRLPCNGKRCRRLRRNKPTWRSGDVFKENDTRGLAADTIRAGLGYPVPLKWCIRCVSSWRGETASSRARHHRSPILLRQQALPDGRAQSNTISCKLRNRCAGPHNCSTWNNFEAWNNFAAYAAMRKRPSRMICSDPASDSSQILKPRPTTSMWVPERQGAPVCSP